MWVQSLGGDDPLEEVMATHSSILAWRIPWAEDPGRLQSMGSQRVGRDWSDLDAHALEPTWLSLVLHTMAKSCFLKWKSHLVYPLLKTHGGLPYLRIKFQHLCIDARLLPFSLVINGNWKWKLLSHVQLSATPWTVACQAPLSMEFSRPEWVAIPFSRGSSQPRDRTQVSHIAGWLFTVWATREDLMAIKKE